jgi:hypothetical protein
MTPEEWRAAKRQLRIDGAKADAERRQAVTMKRLEQRYGKPEAKQ